MAAATFAYFATGDRAGETKDFAGAVQEILKGLQESLLKKHASGIENYPLWKCIQSTQATTKEEEEEGKVKNCDQVFCEYLREVSKVTNPEYFSTVVKFVILYRECLNEYGWHKFGARPGVAPENESENEKEEAKSRPEEYVVVNSPEFIPELANELVLSYLPEKGCLVPSTEATSLIINFCEWLLNSGYTCTKVGYVKK